ncbi:hypothetical protein UFOVP326_86 [uncultured Caudovirales phage]|uniref:Helix-turn-helix domain containing protein n=1 Tax=uncultured Caudovirales phage TaxID=2100421 RepID=A0A6J5LXJ8_9CAUD|nr:hypothetical protein UFOVP326_86 [uncultured Caudovirales phage]
MHDPRAFLARVESAWRERATTPDGRRLTRLHVHIAAKLAYWRSTTPRHRALARAARCSTRTVRRALDRLRALELLSWTRRVVRGVGWRAQVSNAYRLAPLAEQSSCYQVLKSPAVLSPSGTATPASAPVMEAPLLLARRLAVERMLASRRRE